MKLLEKNNCFLIDAFSKSSIIAGFTKPNLSGDVIKDIPKVLSWANFKFKIAFLKQIHSARINYIKESGCYTGDGLITQKNNLVCVVRTADCLPIFLSSKKPEVIGIIHMGWRGAKSGILENIKYDLGHFKVILGVGMRKCCYEVGEEFLNYPQFRGFIKEDNGHFRFDPAGFAKKNLTTRGLAENNFSDLNICSACSKESFSSFRRNSTDNRTLSFIVRRE
jgi:YfiH family protein